MAATPEQEAIITGENLGYMATLKRDGSPQVTPINYAYVDGNILISTTKDRAKYHNVRRNPNVCVCIVQEGGRPYVTVYGKARVEEDDIVDGTAAIMRNMSNREAPDNFAEALRQQRRVLIVLTPERFVP
ncbi:MAG: PPOX class F420-dependent oxidoreductase [Dehalococcoidia bacterium]